MTHLFSPARAFTRKHWRYRPTLEQLECRLLPATLTLPLDSTGSAFHADTVTSSTNPDVFDIQATVTGRMSVLMRAEEQGMLPLLSGTNGTTVADQLAIASPLALARDHLVQFAVTIGQHYYLSAGVELTVSNDGLPPHYVLGPYQLYVSTEPTIEFSATTPHMIPLDASGLGVQLGTITPGDVGDLFAFTATVTGRAVVRVNGGVNTGQELDLDIVPKHTYGFLVSQAGPYVVTVTSIADDFPDNQVFPIALDATGSGSQSGAINYSGDVDVFRFTASVSGTMTLMMQNKDGSSDISTLSSELSVSGATVTYDISPSRRSSDSTPASDRILQFHVDAGHEYTLRASGANGSIGSYQLSLSMADDGPDTTLKIITLDSSGAATQPGGLEVPGDRDRFKFTATVSGYMVVALIPQGAEKDGIAWEPGTNLQGLLTFPSTPIVVGSIDGQNVHLVNVPLEYFSGAGWLETSREQFVVIQVTAGQTYKFVVSADVAITSQPTDQTVVAGQTATFIATASGVHKLPDGSLSPPTFQWQRSNAGGPWTDISGATAASYSIATAMGDSGAQFRVVVSGSVVSDPAALTVLTATPGDVAITSQPIDQTVAAGQTATFIVTASGGRPLPLPYGAVASLPTFQWQRSNDGGATWTPIIGATAASYSIATHVVDSGAQFRVVVSNSVTSNAATLKVFGSLPGTVFITSGPLGQTVTAGQTATFSVTTAGDNPTFQWQRLDDGATKWVAITGATASWYTTPARALGDTNTQYRVVLNGTPSLFPARLTVIPGDLVITAQPASQTVAVGQTATFRVIAIGGSRKSDGSIDNPPTIQWQRRDNADANWVDISGATGSSYTTPATDLADSGAQFQAVVRNSAGSVIISGIANLRVIEEGYIGNYTVDLSTFRPGAIPSFVTSSDDNLSGKDSAGFHNRRTLSFDFSTRPPHLGIGVGSIAPQLETSPVATSTTNTRLAVFTLPSANVSTTSATVTVPSGQSTPGTSNSLISTLLAVAARDNAVQSTDSAVAALKTSDVASTLLTSLLVGAIVPGAGGGDTGTEPMISGTVFDDLNGNGRLDAGEPGVAGEIIVLEVQKGGQYVVVGAALTDATGAYALAGVTAGDYRVRRVAQADSGPNLTTPASYAVKVMSDSKPRVFNFGRAVKRRKALNFRDHPCYCWAVEDVVHTQEGAFAEEIGRAFQDWNQDDSALDLLDDRERDRAATDWWLGLLPLVPVAMLCIPNGRRNNTTNIEAMKPVGVG